MSVALRPRSGRHAAERATARRVDAAAPAASPVAAGGPYIGLVTRVIAFAIDAAVVNAVALAVGAAVTLALSVISVPEEVRVAAAAVGSAVYLLWVMGYFVTFWTTTGQTPGDRLLRIRVVPAAGGGLPPRRALLRFAALTLAALPLFAGFALILVDDRRRGLHDMIARTVVVDAPGDGPEPPGPT
ncbi:MAG TPA: RDD family protein [Baekduia sp.]|nr:RDD family protein [Baekduia sp.]